MNPSPSAAPRVVFHVFVLVVTAVVAAAGGWFAALRCSARPQELVDLEHAFRDRCKVVGAHEAFVEFAGREAVFFDVDPRRLRGLKALESRREGWKAIQQLEWEPVESFVACSGELGYTWGTSEIHLGPGDNGEPRIVHGHYVCIWKREADGRWRIALDTGNARPDPKGRSGE